MSDIKKLLSGINNRLKIVDQHNHESNYGKNECYRKVASFELTGAINDLKNYFYNYFEKKMEDLNDK